MVLSSAANHKRPINLFNQQQAYHLMGKRHLGKAQRKICTLSKCVRVPERTANNKSYMAVSV